MASIMTQSEIELVQYLRRNMSNCRMKIDRCHALAINTGADFKSSEQYIDYGEQFEFYRKQLFKILSAE